MYICYGRNGERTGPLACLSPFAVKSVDKGHLLRLWVSKLPCYLNKFPNNSLAHELNKERDWMRSASHHVHLILKNGCYHSEYLIETNTHSLLQYEILRNW